MILTELARRAAQAIDNAQRDSAHVATSQALQQALLPRALPQAEGVEFAAAYLPESAGADVGGDFYDVLALGQDRWIAVVGDVCGKGPRAAARTGLVRDVLRVLLRDGQSLRPDVRAAQRDDAGGRRPVAVRDRGARADHPAAHRAGVASRWSWCWPGTSSPRSCYADGNVSYLGTHGSAVGLVRKFAVHPTRHVLLAGDTLVFYTDGVTEHRRGAELFGQDRLAKALRRAGNRTADGLITAVRQAVDDFSAEPHRDDIAIVAVRVPPGRSSRVHWHRLLNVPDPVQLRTERPVPNCVVLSVLGEIDLVTVPGLDAAIAEHVAAAPCLVLDLSGVTFFGSLGLAALIRAMTLAEERGTRLLLVAGCACPAHDGADEDRGDVHRLRVGGGSTGGPARNLVCFLSTYWVTRRYTGRRAGLGPAMKRGSPPCSATTKTGSQSDRAVVRGVGPGDSPRCCATTRHRNASGSARPRGWPWT